MTLILMLLAPAMAEDLQPGVLPGATKTDGVEASAGAGIACDGGIGCGPMLEVQVSPLEPFAIIAEGPLLIDEGAEDAARGIVAARWNVVDVEAVRIAPLVGVATTDMITDDPSDDAAFFAGAAFDAGFGNFHVDGAMPLLVFSAPRDLWSAGQVIEGLDLGASWTPQEPHTVRLGLKQLDPTVSYRFEQDMFYAEGEAGWSLDDDDAKVTITGGVRL